METINLGVDDELPPVDGSAVHEQVGDGSRPAPDAHNSRTTWLTTVNEDGTPHVTAVGALWLDGTFWFQTGEGTRKSHNVARDPALLGRRIDPRCRRRGRRRSGPGDRPGRRRPRGQGVGGPGLAGRTRSRVASGITAPFNAPSQGPPPWNVYRIEPRSATVVLGAEPGGLTRFEVLMREAGRGSALYSYWAMKRSTSGSHLGVAGVMPRACSMPSTWVMLVMSTATASAGRPRCRRRSPRGSSPTRRSAASGTVRRTPWSRP